MKIDLEIIKELEKELGIKIIQNYYDYDLASGGPTPQNISKDVKAYFRCKPILVNTTIDKVIYLCLRNLGLTYFPRKILELKDLEYLNLKENQISHISDDLDFSSLKNLTVLSLRGNPIKLENISEGIKGMNHGIYD
jgi:Leucine-rich repeat (LRR) protein